MNMDTIKEIDVKSVMTKSSLPVGGYSVNPYVGCPHACRYCYASFMKRFTGHTEPWGTFLDVKNWKPITNPHKYDGERVVIGSVTDGYNPYEEEFHRTRRLLEELRGSDAEIMICTKSDLVLRDLDLLKSFPKVTVSWSVNTLDEQFCADMDNAVSIERRLKAMRQTYEAGIRTVCFVSPIFPRITDVKAIIEEVKDYADLIWLENLNLRGQFKGGIMTYIREKYPDLIPLYEEIYNKKRLEYWQALEQDISNYAKVDFKKFGLNHWQKIDFSLLGKILSISCFTMIQYFLAMATWFVFFIAIERLGQRELAIANIVRSIYIVMLIPVQALSTTTNSLVSNLIGAGGITHVMRLIWRIARMSFLIMVVCVAVVVLFPHAMLSVYTNEPALLVESVPSLYVIAGAMIIASVANIYFNAISGTGNTQAALILEMGTLVFYALYILWIGMVVKAPVSVCFSIEVVYYSLLLLSSIIYLKKAKWQNKKI